MESPSREQIDVAVFLTDFWTKVKVNTTLINSRLNFTHKTTYYGCLVLIADCSCSSPEWSSR